MGVCENTFEKHLHTSMKSNIFAPLKKKRYLIKNYKHIKL